MAPTTPPDRPVRARFVSMFHGETFGIPAVVVGVGVAGGAILIGAHNANISVVSTLSGTAAFLFGVLLAFSIQRSRERLSTVQNLISKGNSALLAIYELMVVFGEEDRRHIRELIDRHLTEQIDYHLVDYYRADGSFYELAEAVFQLELENKSQENAHKVLLDLGAHSMNDRSSIESATAQAMSATEWLGLVTLLFLLLALIAVVPEGNVLGSVVAGILAGALVVLMSLVRRLDRLRWHERSAIWEPTTRLFRQMGQHPYVPREVIEAGRYQPTGLIRVVEFPDPYPIRSTKRITVEYFPPPAEHEPKDEGASEGPLVPV